MHGLNPIQYAAVAALPLLFAITLHEVAHGWVARRLGDRTAQMLGRLTLNPLKHIDPVGTLLVPGLMLLFGGVVFGWAKPVPVDWRNLHHPKRDMAVVAVAGPLANLAMALLWALVARLGLALLPASTWMGVPLVLMGKAGVLLNLILMILNLLPLPPLDGGRVLVGLLPRPWDLWVARIEPWGLFVLIALLVTGVLTSVIGPPIFGLDAAIQRLFGI